jgi:hypothetical protein
VRLGFFHDESILALLRRHTDFRVSPCGVAATDTFASLLEGVPRGRLLSPKPLDEVKLDAGQWTADVVQGIAIGERPEIDRDQAGTVDQFDH